MLRPKSSSDFFVAAFVFTLVVALPAPAGAVCPCSSSPGFDNFCHYPPSTSGCPMTFPGGYCDPNGDASYSDADYGSLFVGRLLTVIRITSRLNQ